MLRIFTILTLTMTLAFPPLAHSQEQRGEAIGKLLGEGLNCTAAFLQKHGPDIVDKGQELLDNAAQTAAPTWKRGKLAFQVTRDYERFCSLNTGGVYADTPLCSVLRPKLANGGAPLTAVFTGLSQQAGFSNGQPNSAAILALAMSEHLEAKPIEGYGLTPHTFLKAIYDNLRHCNGNPNKGCGLAESQGEAFQVILTDIINLLEKSHGTSGNTTADAVQTVKATLQLDS